MAGSAFLDARGGTLIMGYAAIHLAEFPAMAWLRQHSDARSRASAVIEGQAPLERIVSFNSAAGALGLTHGMSKVQAGMAGEVIFHPRSFQQENAAMDEVFTAAQRFSPRVQIVASPVNAYARSRTPDAILLVDRTGTETLFGDAKSFAGKTRQALLELQFTASVAVAPNAEASLLLASSCPGITQADVQDVQQKLAPLPVATLRCDDALLSTLKRWGIRTLGELAALPQAALISRIGQQGKRLQRLARGCEDRLLVPEEPAFTLAEHVALDSPLESLESLLFLLSPMLEKLLLQAINHAYALGSLTIKMILEKGASHSLEVRPAVPAQSKNFLLKLLHLKLEADPPQSGILAVMLTAQPAIPQVAQRGLFHAQFPEPDKLDLLIARLKSIAGQNNVGSPVLSNSFREDDFIMASFQPGAGREIARKAPAVRSALRRFRPSHPVRVVFRDALPALLFWRGERLELGTVTGPWQTSGYWWDERRWQASEWDAIVCQPPQALRLRHEHGTWYVAGEYD